MWWIPFRKFLVYIKRFCFIMKKCIVGRNIYSHNWATIDWCSNCQEQKCVRSLRIIGSRAGKVCSQLMANNMVSNSPLFTPICGLFCNTKVHYKGYSLLTDNNNNYIDLVVHRFNSHLVGGLLFHMVKTP